MGVEPKPGGTDGDSRRLSTTFHEVGFASNRPRSHFTGKVTGKVVVRFYNFDHDASGTIRTQEHRLRDLKLACGNAGFQNRGGRS